MKDADGGMAQSPSERRAAAFRRTREAHKSEVAEDYVELIGDLIAEQGEARLTDVAENMAVTQATAAKIVARLKREGLVENKPYRSLFLTEVGTRMADRSRVRHRVVYDFLRALGIDDAVAEADSEGMEHHVSDVTLEALSTLTYTLKQQRG